jgi:murein DD-endopeptidase MepM/ murein hydrolase activator NlpD
VALSGPFSVEKPAIEPLSGRSAARLARLLREQEVGSSNLPAPTTSLFTTNKLLRPVRVVSTFAVLWFALLVVSPALADSQARYTVRSGDNLTHIAKRYGVTVGQLRTDNSLKSDVLHVGQKLRLKKPFSRKSSKRITWLSPYPRSAKVLMPFGQYKREGILMPQTGAEIACNTGTKVSVPADGILRHIGPLEGFGTVAILEHAGRYATVLAPLDPASISAKVGDALRRGDTLGRTATPDDVSKPPYLHVELRRNDKAIRPDPLLR